jgi:peptidoglycan endopeptidase LytE
MTVIKKVLRCMVAMMIAMTMVITGTGQWAYAAVDDMDAVSLAKRYIGKDYKRGGSSPTQGFNASGLIDYVYSKLGYNMPGNIHDQFKKGRKINSIWNLRYGDLLFFGPKDKPTFAGIYVGNRKMVMSSQSRDEVVIRTLNSSLQNQFISARRVLTKSDHSRAKIMIEAEQYLGTPYVFGAKYGQTRTFDCSSFVKTVFDSIDVTMPRVSRNQAKEGSYVSKKNLQVGDLVFFTTSSSKGNIGHVGIYAGDGDMIHTYGEGGVKYTSIHKGYWEKRYVTARRIIK